MRLISAFWVGCRHSQVEDNGITLKCWLFIRFTHLWCKPSTRWEYGVSIFKWGKNAVYEVFFVGSPIFSNIGVDSTPHSSPLQIASTTFPVTYTLGNIKLARISAFSPPTQTPFFPSKLPFFEIRNASISLGLRITGCSLHFCCIKESSTRHY